jgi:hypothetical protein
MTGTITLVDPGLAEVLGKETAMLTAGLSEEEAALPETFPKSETAVRPAGTKTNDNIKPKTRSSNGLRVTSESVRIALSLSIFSADLPGRLVRSP